MSSLKLYSYYRSSCSYRVRVALAFKELQYEYIPIHLLKNGGEQNQQNFLRLNPKGEVPVLLHGEFKLTQSMAILLYLDQVFPEKRLFPEKTELFARCIQICEVVNSGIQPLQGLRTTQQLQQLFRLGTEDSHRWCVYWIEKGLHVLEEMVVGPFALGEQMSAADMAIVPQLYNARRYNVSIGNFSKLQTLDDHCSRLKCFQLAHPDVCPDKA